jgi:hypothetical protein
MKSEWLAVNSSKMLKNFADTVKNFQILNVGGFQGFDGRRKEN